MASTTGCANRTTARHRDCGYMMEAVTIVFQVLFVLLRASSFELLLCLSSTNGAVVFFLVATHVLNVADTSTLTILNMYCLYIVRAVRVATIGCRNTSSSDV